MKPDTDELLPCPFCASANVRLEEAVYCRDDGEFPGVVCDDCEALGPCGHGNADAIAQWNRAWQARAATVAPRGYAHLGIGEYIINHSRAGELPELCISFASEEEKRTRAIGDSVDNAPDSEIRADEMLIRLRFENVAGLDALETQLRFLREVHFPAATVAPDAELTSALNAAGITKDDVLRYVATVARPPREPAQCAECDAPLVCVECDRDAAPVAVLPVQPERGKNYSRNGDMTPPGDSVLIAHVQHDGDVCLRIDNRTPRLSRGYDHVSADIEFCCSGGKSINTLHALHNLVAAMAKDAALPLDTKRMT